MSELEQIQITLILKVNFLQEFKRKGRASENDHVIF